ncbi:MAG: ESX-1 secretion-associated protein [Mycobacterium sp.]
MQDRILVDPAKLRDAARHHAEAADHLRAVPDSHQSIQDSLESLGPIFGELRDAARELLEQRRLCYQQQADDHADMADNLQRSAAMWEDHDAASAQQMHTLLGENR